jgi:hypothetical protein
MAHNAALRPPPALRRISLSLGPLFPTSGNNSSSVMMPPTNQLERAAAMIRRVGHEIHFIAVLGPSSPHRRRQLPVGKHCRPGLLHPHVDDGRGCRFALGAAIRSGDGQRKLGPGSWGFYQLIPHAAFAAKALARRSFSSLTSQRSESDPGSQCVTKESCGRSIGSSGSVIFKNFSLIVANPVEAGC